VTRARILFVPGLNPKPPPELYRRELLRVMLAGLQRSRPRAAEWLAANPEAFTLVAWTYLFYGAHREISVDLPGIERLLAREEPTADDLRDLASWSRRFMRWTHVVGDAVPWLGRRLAPPATRRLMHEATRYLKNRDGVGVEVRSKLREALDLAWRDGADVLLIGHSLGSVIAYDTLWELSRERGPEACVAVFVTLGSPLATHFVQRSLKGATEHGAARYPANIRRWVNLTANADVTALQPRLAPLFHEMLSLGLVESFEDFVGLDNFFRGASGLNAHEAYGYLAQRVLAEVVGDWLERSLSL
jgi:hypothetical protein